MAVTGGRWGGAAAANHRAAESGQAGRAVSIPPSDRSQHLHTGQTRLDEGMKSRRKTSSSSSSWRMQSGGTAGLPSPDRFIDHLITGHAPQQSCSWGSRESSTAIGLS